MLTSGCRILDHFLPNVWMGVYLSKLSCKSAIPFVEGAYNSAIGLRHINKQQIKISQFYLDIPSIYSYQAHTWYNHCYVDFTTRPVLYIYVYLRQLFMFWNWTLLRFHFLPAHAVAYTEHSFSFLASSVVLQNDVKSNEPRSDEYVFSQSLFIYLLSPHNIVYNMWVISPLVVA